MVMLAGFHPVLEEEVFFPLQDSHPLLLGSSFTLVFWGPDSVIFSSVLPCLQPAFCLAPQARKCAPIFLILKRKPDLP